MAEFATVARPYAKALFDLAKEHNRIESWLGELKTLAGIVSQPKIEALITTPDTGYSAKADTLLSLLDVPPAAELKNFLYMLAQNKRLAILPQIYALFQDYALSRNHTKEAVIYTAFPIASAQFAELVVQMEAHFRTKLKAVQVVDASLIGGVKVVVGDQVLDLSVQARLNSLHAAMMN